MQLVYEVCLQRDLQNSQPGEDVGPIFLTTFWLFCLLDLDIYICDWYLFQVNRSILPTGMCIFLEYYFKMFVYDLFMNWCNKTHLNCVLDTLSAKLSEANQHRWSAPPWIVAHCKYCLRSFLEESTTWVTCRCLLRWCWTSQSCLGCNRFGGALLLMI